MDPTKENTVVQLCWDGHQCYASVVVTKTDGHAKKDVFAVPRTLISRRCRHSLK